MSSIFLTSCAVLFVVPMLFVWNRVYKDGLFGRLGLLGISSAAAMFLLEYFDGSPVDIIPAKAVLLVASFAIFLTWHLFRFHSRVLKKKEAADSWPGVKA